MTRRDTLTALGHELRNLLSTVQLSLDELSDPTQETTKPCVQTLAQRIQNALSEAQDICEAAMKEAATATHRIPVEPINIRKLVEHTAEKLVPRNRAQADIDIVCDPSLYANLCPIKLFRILFNLVDNAIRAVSGHAQGYVAVCVRTDGTSVIIDVIDNGPGFSDLPAIAANEATADAWEWTGPNGFGLKSAMHLTRSMGGRLSLVRSDTSGATMRMVFCYCLPAKPVSALHQTDLLDGQLKSHSPVWKHVDQPILTEGRPAS